MAIVIKFVPNKTDLIRAGYAGLRARPVIFFVSVLFFIVIPLATAVLLAVFGDESHKVNTITLAVIPPVTVAFFLYLPVQLHGKSPSLNGEHVYEFSDSEIHLLGPGFDNHVQWSLVTKFIKIHGVYLLFSNKAPIITVPVRGIPVSSSKEFDELLRSRIKA